MLFVLFFYRILKYAYLLRYVACLGYKKRIILSIDNENCAPSSGSFIIVNSGVVWGGVCVRGIWRSPLVVMGGGRGVQPQIRKSWDSMENANKKRK